jgi:hypothetical protein
MKVYHGSYLEIQTHLKPWQEIYEMLKKELTNQNER